MQVNNVASQINDLVKKSNRVLLITRENPTLDGIYSLLALKSYLKSENKHVMVVAGELPEAKELFEKEEIIYSLPARNLVISFDYVEDSIEKVSYNVEGNKFNLVISPRHRAINPEQINYSYSGENFDLIFVVGVAEISLISKGAVNIQSDYNEAPLINVDHTPINTLYGQLNFVDTTKTSTSEVVFELLKQLQKLDVNSSQIIYQGIKAATLSFSLGVKSQALETAASCLKIIEGTTKSKEEFDEKKDTTEIKDETSSAKEDVPDSSWLSPKIYRSSHISE